MCFTTPKPRNSASNLALISTVIAVLGCNPETEQKETDLLPGTQVQSVTSKLFTLLTSKQTGVSFSNNLFESDINNYYTYMYFYNGGGVSVGDINNDSLPDLYFTGNQVANKLYLNLGGMKFKDITELAGVEGKGGWRTGTTMVDINNDGYLDIYVCRSYNINNPDMRENLLYINNGDLTFSEHARAYGLNDNGYSTQANFFDYDLDGDLDMYLVNHPIDFGDFNKERYNKRLSPNNFERDKLYRNNNDGTFTEISKSAGIFNYGFGLSATIGDLNNDGWPDIYVANDFEEPDFFYLNNQDGTFTDKLQTAFKNVSQSSMGCDIADINNDGLLDLTVVEMMAEDNLRQKTNMPSMNPTNYWRLVNIGYHHQNMRNTLQLNNGNGTFSEISQLAGTSKTDWSWSALFADFDNDGFKDLFITNGVRRDMRDNDFTKTTGDFQKRHGRLNYKQANEMAPLKKLSNYIFKNNGNLTFTKKIVEWGMNFPNFSNGAAYADLDLDGDLDLVVNNLEDTASIFENNSRQKNKNNYIQIRLRGDRIVNGIGAKITLVNSGQTQFQELTLTRGFQSSVDQIIHFGLASIKIIDEIKIEWPDGKVEILMDIPVNRLLTIYQKNASDIEVVAPVRQVTLFKETTDEAGFTFTHKENVYDDFAREKLLPHKLSQNGPKIAIGDVNGDNVEDFFIGGASGSSGAMYIQNMNGTFTLSNSQPWEKDKVCEDMGALFFDSDGDGDLDLYVVSGGNEFELNSSYLQDRLYLNDGSGIFQKTTTNLPSMLTSGSCVISADFDEDGDLDLFVGGRLIPGKYPFPPRSYLLQNSNGTFKDITERLAPTLTNIGMVTDALWTDFDQNGSMDLIVVGEWMPISFYKNNNGKFENVTASLNLDNTTGWWNSITAGDFDNDGDTDYIAGNLGLNSKFKASEAEPLHVYCNDFDANGSLDIVLAYYNKGICYPVRGKDCSSDQMPFLNNKFQTYRSFGEASVYEVYGNKLDEALHYAAKMFESISLENLGNGRFSIEPLPVEAQFSSVFGIVVHDFDNDNILDLLLAGNFYAPEVETGRSDAGIGLFLKVQANGKFTSIKLSESGFYAPGDVKDMKIIKSPNAKSWSILIANNNAKMQVFQLR